MGKLLLLVISIFLFNLVNSMAYIPLDVNDETINLDEIETNDDIFLFNKILTDSEINKLLDTTITFQSADYDISEEIVIDFKVDLEKGYKNNIKYYYGFDETIDLSQTSITDPLEIKFLGETLKIVEINSDNSFTIQKGKEYPLNSGDSVVVDGKTIKLVRVGSAGAVVVDVNGVQETIPRNEIETVNGIEIFNRNTYYDSNNQAASAAVLIIGEDIFQDYKDGDDFGSEWRWNIGNLNEKSATLILENGIKGPYIGIENNPSWEELDSEECFDLPNDYVNICVPNLEDYFIKDEQGCLAGQTCCGNNICETGEDKENCFEDCKICVDNDRDGFKAGDCNEDCDDNNPRINPRFPEVCDSIDNNCNGKIDEDLIRDCGITDIGECSFGVETCVNGTWSKCNAVFPVEEVNDNLDNDCDSEIDEDFTITKIIINWFKSLFWG